MAEQQTQALPVAMVRCALELAAQVEEHRDPLQTVTASASFGAPDGPGIAAVDSDHGIFVVFAPTQDLAAHAATIGAQLINGSDRPPLVRTDSVMVDLGDLRIDETVRACPPGSGWRLVVHSDDGNASAGQTITEAQAGLDRVRADYQAGRELR